MVIDFEGVYVDSIKAWRTGVKFKSYINRETAYVDWILFQSENVRFVQISTKNRASDFRDDLFVETHFVPYRLNKCDTFMW